MSELELENSGTCSSGALMPPQDTERPSLKKMIDEMKPCSVILEKLSEDVINYHLSRIDLNFSKQERAKKKFAKHKLQHMSKINYHLFERYRDTRQKFINKERRKSEDYADEDFDPERYFSDDRCKKKRSRRKPAYEDDYDWDPSAARDKYGNKANRSTYSPKRLRRIMKRPISESESSSSDFFDYFLEEERDFNENEPSASRSAGVSVGDISQSIKNTQITNATKDMDGDQTDFNTSKVLPQAISDSSSLNLTSESSKNNDIISKIIKDMDNLKSTKNVNKICQHPNASISNKGKLHENVVLRPTGQMRKRSKMRNPDVRVVRAIINNMVNSVCSAENKRLKNIVNNNNKKKKCRWCAALFTSSNKNDVYCLICKDRKIGFIGKSVYKMQNKSKPNEKNLGTAKATNSKNKMMDKLRKNMPKYEIQRLMYADKTDKAAVEKGYNHCKSFNTSKDGNGGIATFSNPCTFSQEQQSDKISNKGNTQKKKNQPNILVNATATSGKNTLKKSNPSKAKKVSKGSPTLILSSKSKKINESKKINANKVCVTNVDKGLFLMTFPEPDKELDVNVLKESTLENANNVNRSTVIKMATDKIESKKDLSSNMKNIQPPGTTLKNLPFGTYLLPPVPTVVVANYAATDDSNGDFYLSSVYYQNEMTQQKGAIVDSVVVRNENLNNSIVQTSLAPSMPSGTDLINMSNASIFPASQSNILMPVASLPDGSFIKTVDMVSNSGIKSSELARHLTLPVPGLNQIAHSNDSFSSDVVSNENCHTSETENCFSSENQFIPNVPNMNSEMSLFEMNSESIAQERESTKEQLTNNFDPSNTNPYAVLDTSASNSNIHENLNMTSNADKDTSSKIGLPEGNSSVSELDEMSLNSDTSGINANSSENLLTEAYQEIEAISILGVVDLDKNPHVMLAYRIEVVKKQYEQLKNQKDKVVDERLGDIHSQYASLLKAKELLNKFRSFARVSEYYLRKEKFIQIKKEKMMEEDNERPACQYSKNSASNELANFVGEESVSSASGKTDQINKSYSLANDASSVNHIEKIQFQIAAINETSSPSDHVPGSVMHHFPAPSNSSVVTVSTPVTPGNELGNEARETPSRGSGPRTPARPESATSQLEENILTPAQVKRERLEAVTSPFSQCAYSVSSPSPHLTIPSPNVPQVTSPLANMMPVNSNVSLTVSNNNSPQFQNTTYSQNKDIPPNRTVPFNTNQNLSKVLLNLAAHQQQIQNTNPNMNINNPQNNVLFNNGKVINVQQIYLPGGAKRTQKLNVQPVPSVSNTNQYILRQPSVNTANTNGGTVLVNNHVASQKVWHRNEANPQVFAPQQVSQVYNTPPTQMTVSASHQQSSSPAFAVQNKESADESTDQMFCAVCNNIATLRCKQCAKVAYCNTACARTYWHQKHKMECKPMTNLI
ncbi:uncharacterized protein LOC118200849 isoform X2 [Stegodyphus dumicola]|nr:uncharacterized protein LOC118200849 isoform X2 [Stegodyphus dumicola]